MQIKYIKQILTAGLAISILAIAIPAVVGAVENTEQPVTTTNEPQQQTEKNAQQERLKEIEAKRIETTKRLEEKRQEELKKLEEKRNEQKKKLDEVKLKVCKNREKAITNIMTRSVDRGNKQLETFTKISERVQNFYKEKGLVISNYDELITEIDYKKTDAEAAIAKTKETAPTFKCDGTDPKGVAETFKESVKAQNESLKLYRTAVKNLIVAVRSLAEKPENTEGGQQ